MNDDNSTVSSATAQWKALKGTGDDDFREMATPYRKRNQLPRDIVDTARRKGILMTDELEGLTEDEARSRINSLPDLQE